MAFGYFGSVFKLVRYDNLTAAVRKVMKEEVCENLPGQIILTKSGVFRPNGFHAYAIPHSLPLPVVSTDSSIRF